MELKYKFGVKEMVLLSLYLLVSLFGTWIFVFFGEDLAEKTKEFMEKRKENNKKKQEEPKEKF